MDQVEQGYLQRALLVALLRLPANAVVEIKADLEGTNETPVELIFMGIGMSCHLFREYNADTRMITYSVSGPDPASSGATAPSPSPQHGVAQ
jgi:hypothetical protein